LIDIDSFAQKKHLPTTMVLRGFTGIYLYLGQYNGSISYWGMGL
jgi:hypothetical protein